MEVITEPVYEENLKKQIAKINISDKDLRLAFNDERHLESIEGIDWKTQTWRMKERMKTVSVALVLCLNVGVDPPDIIKTQPCAKLECWIDPLTMSGPKALENIGQALQAQYERWQPRARYKQSLDPTADEVKKLCLSLRRNAKEERVLFHYNGHGVPKPTSNGEIWVFNRTYTQYIPLSIYDLQTWMGAPSIYVYDCSNAGIIVESFKTFAAQHESEYQQSLAASPSSRSSPGASPPSFRDCIQLAACSANQHLPMNPELPADLFTSCLTTPIKIALRWAVLQSSSKLIPNVTLDMVDKVPGNITDRKSMFGELNWIFTAITDTIAWNTLPRELFQKLFRQDLLVASLFRNFLLAERIMRSCDCTPISSPALPPTYQHPMWAAWDLVLDLCLGQLPAICAGQATFKNLPFFEEQLTAFEVWLRLGAEERKPPEQLPIVLQVLLSQVHRTRALELLGKFLDLGQDRNASGEGDEEGPWAVNLALSVGIFPYVLKLLQSFAKELRPLLVYIWSKILAVDTTCQADLIREQGHKYFLSILQDSSMPSETRTQATFILSCLVSNYRDGQEAASQGSLVSVCLEQLSDPNPQLRRWVAICLGRLWDHYESARWTGVRDTAHEKLYRLLGDPCPEVRAAAVYALGTFINSVSRRSEHANNIDHSVGMTLVNHAGSDASPLVRKELVGALQWLILAFDVAFAAVAAKEAQFSLENQTSNTLPRIASRDRLTQPDSTFRRIPSSPTIVHISNHTNMNNSYGGSLGTLPGLGYGSVYMKIWSALCQSEGDPYPDVSEMCLTITNYIRSLVKEQRDVVDNRSSSMSLPPSPNRGMFLSGDSPPALHSSGDFQSKLTRSAIATRTRKKKNSIDENVDPKSPIRRPLVTTNFVLWSSKQFVRNKKEKYSDKESKHYYERDWRRARNISIRQEAREEKERAITARIESQVFHTRTAVPPSILQLHPFNQQIAVAGNDSFAIWDWGTGAKTTVLQQKSSIKGRTSKVSALEWVNGHDLALLMVAADDGSLRVWRPNVGNREPTLISAWQVFNNFVPKQTGVILAWEQYTQTLITTGDTKLLRFWDIEKELKAFDIPTEPSTSNVRRCEVCALDIPTSRYQGHLRTLQHRSRCSVLQEEGVELIRTSFRNRLATYRLPEVQDPTSVKRFLQHIKSRAIKLVGEFVEKFNNIKVGVELFGRFILQSKEVEEVKSFLPKFQMVNGNTDVEELFEQLSTILEKKMQDFQEKESGTDASVTCIDSTYSGPSLNISPVTQRRSSFYNDSSAPGPRCGFAAVGCSDGSVRLFDRRCGPQEAGFKVWMEHSGTVLAVQLQDNSIISGSSSGDIKIYDIRTNNSYTNVAIPNFGMSCMSIHRSANTYACGSSNQFISIFTAETGTPLNTIRFYEGFMGHRIGPVTCLSFHPHKVVLAAGTSDCCVNVYSLEPPSRR